MHWLAALLMLNLSGGAVAAGSTQSTPAATSPAPGVSSHVRFRESVAELHRKYGVPAVATAVFSMRGFEAAEAFGVRRSASGNPVELGDRFYIASITKPMTATLAATMVDSGLIQWSTTVEKVWPTWAARMNPLVRKVTLAQLLSHEAGILPLTSDDELVAVPSFSGTGRAQRLAFARWLLSNPAASPVGKHNYSNAGFGIAAAMLEQVANKSWEDLIRERLFQPLALSSCGFGFPASLGEQPLGHIVLNGRYVEPEQARTPALPPYIAPGGDIHCNVVDLARFGEAHLLGIAGRHPLLKHETFRAMHGAEDGYVLGWNLQDAGSSHLGGVTSGWHASLFVSPGAQIVVGVLINARNPGKTDELFTEMTQLAFDLFGRDKGNID
jgi:CubicO group peptidase (beta-lactamase class C family)